MDLVHMSNEKTFSLIRVLNAIHILPYLNCINQVLKLGNAEDIEVPYRR